MKEEMKKSKRGQITIFIIIAIIIVLGIALFFAMIKKPSDYIPYKENPKGGIQLCAKNAAINAEKAILPMGGLINLSASQYVSFNNTKALYLCYTSGDRELCENKHPLLNLEIQNEIKRLIEPKVRQCFEDLKSEFVNNNYQEKELSLNIILEVNGININITKEITYSLNEKTITIKNFDTRINSPVYEFIRISNQVANEETDCNCATQSCNADLIKINKYNREFETTKPAYGGNGDEVYSIKEILTGKIFNFAIRNCVRSP